MLSLKELEAAVADGSIDTIVVAFTDMQGRLMGKRVHGEHFLEENLAESGVEACDYLLALDMDMDPVPGYALANWELGYGDFVLKPDLGHAARDPVARGDRHVPLRRRLARRPRRRPVPAPGAEEAGRSAPAKWASSR